MTKRSLRDFNIFIYFESGLMSLQHKVKYSPFYQLSQTLLELPRGHKSLPHTLSQDCQALTPQKQCWPSSHE